MEHAGWLTKSEINALYYNTVGGEIVFATEAQASFHSQTVARLIANHARGRGRRRIRILEIGANNGAFARVLIQELRWLVENGAVGLERIDYLAVEYSRKALEAAAASEPAADERVLHPGGAQAATDAAAAPTLVALATRTGVPTTHLGFVHAEANQFVAASEEHFDVAILNELLDDMPCRAFYADAEGRQHELVPHARREEGVWCVRIDAPALEDGGFEGMPPGTLTARSRESVELVTGISGLLEPGGLLVMHDYGFAVPFPELRSFEPLPRSVPAIVRFEYPAQSGQGFPRSFYRVYANERLGVIQITNDVNFDEIAAALAPTGTVVTLAHGNAIANHPDFRSFQRGDGVFLSEFGLLRLNEDLPGRLAELEREQESFRSAYERDHVGGVQTVFMDLVYAKG